MPGRMAARVAAAALLGAALLCAVPACAPRKDASSSTPAGGASPLKVGLVFDIGGRGDKSFNDAAYAWLDRAKKELGVDYSCLETS